MNEWEYKFIEKFLTSDDVLLEWGSGNSTLYWSGIVSKVISIEHDVDWINSLGKVIDAYDVKNIELHHIAAHSPNPIPCRYEQFKDYINYPKEKGLKFFDSYETFTTENPCISFKANGGMHNYSHSERIDIPELPYWGKADKLVKQYLG
jgi:hypothetical protein